MRDTVIKNHGVSNALESPMENTFWTALSASVLAALVTTIGIYVIRHFEHWGREKLPYFFCFAAGVGLYQLDHY
jgi:hypothetical protein